MIKSDILTAILVVEGEPLISLPISEVPRDKGYYGRALLKKVEDYFRHASECRELARTASAAHRQQLEQMAATWEQLAEARRSQLMKRAAPDPQGLGIEFVVPPDDDNDPKRKH